MLLIAQERFYNLYNGIMLYYSTEITNGYLIVGLDTTIYTTGIDGTIIFDSIDYYGNFLGSKKYFNDTIASFSTYTKLNHSSNSELSLVSGCYKKYSKDYYLFPLLAFFDNMQEIDSIKDFRNSFGGKSARIFAHYKLGTKYYLIGDVQYSLEANVRTFFGVYDPSDGSFSYKDYTRPNNCVMTPYQLHPAHDGGYIISTEQDMTYLYPKKVKACLVKTDAEGNEQWRYVIGPDSIATYRPRVFDAPDGNYYVVWTDPQRITSTLLQNNLSNTIRIAKLTDYGSYAELSNERDLYVDFGIAIRTYNVIYDCLQTDDGTMYLLLQSLSGYRSVLVKIFPNGRGAWLRSYRVFPENDPTYSETSLYGMSRTSDGGFMLTGEFSSDPGAMFPNGIQSALAIKVDSCGCLDAEGCNPHCGDSYLPQYIRMPQAEVYPNPAVDEIRIVLPNGNGSAGYNIKIYSTSGQLLMEENTEASKDLSVNISELPDGHYRVLISGGGKVYGSGFVKVGR